MRSLCFLVVSLLVLVSVPAFCHRNLTRDHDIVVQENKLGISLPIVASPRWRKHRRAGSVVGLGDYLDVIYNVLVTVGGTTLSVVLDTGSSDLWVTSDTCSTGCGRSAMYPQSTFNSTGQGVKLLYGDSSSGTCASGLIGTDTASIAGLSLSQQYFAAINYTNTSISETGSSGIFGLGFPINSVIFKQVLGSGPGNRKRSFDNDDSTAPSNLNSLVFPDLIGITNQNSQQSADTPPPTVDDILSSFSVIGPLVSRLAATGSLSNPLIAITLQRDTVEIGGNVGTLNLGQLPAKVKSESLTWVPLRRYTVDQGGLAAPISSPHEVYPIAWEVFIDDVYLDGRRLPRSQLSTPDIELSALIDTGNSIIRGPSDVLDYVSSILGNEFPCNEPHELSFSIGGRLFPVDPRDLIMQVYEDNVSICTAKLQSTTTPVIGRYLYSWSLGAPFLKGVLSAYYYGNLSYPSRDPPRMGFLSTVPQDAGEQLVAEANKAAHNGQNFPSRIELAPTGTPTDGSLNSDGVATVLGTSAASTQNSGVIQRGNPRCGVIVGMIMSMLALSL